MKKGFWKLAMSLVLVATILVGCGGTETLESFVNSNAELKEDFDNIGKTSSNSMGDMVLAVKENTLTYTYTYKQTFDSASLELMKTELDKQLQSSSVVSQFQSVAKQLESETKIDGIKVQVVYQNGDKTEISQATFESK